MKTKPIGKVKTTSRGFALVEFKDHYGKECSLQASSLALHASPGISAVWLGCEHESVHEVTGEKIGARMHLNREQVASLIHHLTNWLTKDTF